MITDALFGLQLSATLIIPAEVESNINDSKS